MMPDLSGYHVLPGLINAHDHLEFSLFPRLGNGVYANAAEWARDIYHPDDPPIAGLLRVPKALRLLWGGLRNLLAGVTTVCHHNPYHPVFDDRFPVRVVKRFGWAHSFAFSPDVSQRWQATPHDAPFVLHLGEGTDQESALEILRLREMGALTGRTVIVHGVALDDDAWRLLRRSGASVVWCPSSNVFTLGRTLLPAVFSSGVPIALATDSPLTSAGDLLDELRCAASLLGWPLERLIPLLTTAPARILRIEPSSDDWIAVTKFGASPALVVIRGEIQLVDENLARRLSVAVFRSLRRLEIEGRPPVYVRTDTRDLLRRTREALGSSDVRLAGRLVDA